MPRQLPWLNKGSKIKTQVKAPPKAAKKAEVPSDIDDDFFAGTILETSRNGKERAQSQESDDDLPALPAHSSRKGKGKEPIGRRRVPSSSPPPIVAQLPPPAKELMRPGVDKFDLRDDEWRMVEDEFLHTAKLFTQHLHLEEYELLKKNMEEKKAVARPVVRDAKPSVESQFKERAKTQGKAQRRAMKDFFRASPPRDDGKEDGRKEQAERLAKRRAEREKEKETEQRKAVNVGDIPTFLF
ncbi:hypothetical protein BDV95DRAFT_629706 [Massariosphaeria phaeospora]|uniref:Uncharacterized protein n=1 Tax=Massariosphaeria phaeospora TaxID=100035 RepID=A0A7C8M9N0_9PLEO|nr:hypothetical protein BDV95DRAFT_629706 [Massariosphaeria phaeospora]